MADYVFISHSHDDADFSHRLAANLRARGVEVWVDAWNVAPGADWDMSIDRALYECARYLIVLSPASVDSPEVRGELRIALDENKPIVPVLYRGCLIPRRLRVIQYIDFRERGPDDEAALAEVLRALDVQGAATRARAGRVEQADRIPATPRAPSPAIEEEKLPGVLKPGQPFEPEMVLIPAGEFWMGSDPKVDKGVDDNERPQHRLFLPDYYLARTPVTNAQYEAYVRATGQRAPVGWERGRLPRGKEDHPVFNVPWRDAMAYCRWLAQATGKPYNLPSEAEWEKGARGTDGRIYPWGNRWDAARCNAERAFSGDTTPVGAYPNGASPYGLLDMAGNMWEWTRSLYKGYPYDPDDGREDLEAAGARVVRGGAFSSLARLVRCACRVRSVSAPWFRSVGLRVAVGLRLPL